MPASSSCRTRLTWDEQHANPVSGLRRAQLVLRKRDYITHNSVESRFHELVHYFTPELQEPFYIAFPSSDLVRKIAFDPPRRWDPKLFEPVAKDSLKPNYVFIE